ncbi:hypothetical protein V6Z11_D07G209300 [Gossypium hirsutum]
MIDYLFIIQVITSAYRPLVSNRLSERVVRRTCNAIGLFQTLASHPDTKMSFIRASMPEYLYAFLKTRSRERNYERLRFASLVVIGSLVEVALAHIFCSFLMLISVATFIIYRILLNEKGLNYLLSMPERYLVVTHCLENMVEILDVEDEEYLPHLLKNIIGCYLRISENERIRADLSGYIPWLLVDYKYVNIIRKEKAHANFLFQGDPEAFGNLRRLIGFSEVAQAYKRIYR